MCILILCNISVVTVIFWLITLFEIYLNKNTQHETKSSVYECGFLTVNKNVFPVTTNLIILLMFAVVYEVEFIVITPLFLSINVLTVTQLFSLVLIFFVIVVTLYIDIWLKKINWIY